MGEMTTLPAGFEEFLELLRRRHAAIMDGRPDKNPGAFKTKVNRAGETVFVAPDLVTGTLERGFAFVQALAERSEEHTSELQSLMRISYAVFCWKKKKKK